MFIHSCPSLGCACGAPPPSPPAGSSTPIPRSSGKSKLDIAPVTRTSLLELKGACIHGRAFVIIGCSLTFISHIAWGKGVDRPKAGPALPPTDIRGAVPYHVRDVPGVIPRGGWVGELSHAPRNTRCAPLACLSTILASGLSATVPEMSACDHSLNS